MKAHHRGRFGDNVNLVNLVNDYPPSYGYGTPSRGLRWDPRVWSRKTWIGVTIGAVVLSVVIIVAAVLGSRANRYPSYTKLNYALRDTYQGTAFFDKFDYFTGYDPSQGFVHYVDGPGSTQLNLTYATDTSAILRVDTSEVDASTGRKSARIESKTQYNSGLFVFDIVHTPYGCGTWPALWLADPANWPRNGEIDVVEAVNTATTGNHMTLHTANDCTMNAKRKETGKVLTKDCFNGTDVNAGCGVQGSADTYGQALNSNGGGVYAMEWRTEGIRIWFFPRSSISPDLRTGDSPDPSSWGTALADFPKTDCSINDHFRNQSIIANIDLCGQWAGQALYYTQQAGCPGTCSNLVATNSTAFEDAYWEFKSFKVYGVS